MKTGIFNDLINEFRQTYPNAFAINQYDIIEATAIANKMDASIKGILGVKLNPFIFNGANHLYSSPDKFDFSSLRKTPTAVFVNISDVDRSTNKPASLFFTQCLQVLCKESVPDNPETPFLPVQFFMNDFASRIKISDFDKIISNV